MLILNSSLLNCCIKSISHLQSCCFLVFNKQYLAILVQTILVLNFFQCPNRHCLCVSSELFVNVLLLQIYGCWCGPHWPALTCAARFRDNLLAYLHLPGGLALTCNALYCIFLSLMYCCCAVVVSNEVQLLRYCT